MTLQQHIQAIDEAYRAYCELFNSPTSTLAEQQAQFQVYKEAVEAFEQTR